MGRLNPVILVTLLIFSPSRTMRVIALTCSGVTLTYLPGFEPPHVLPFALAAAWLARMRSARISVSNSATLARIRACGR